MAEGTSFGIVPFMKVEQLAIVSAVVGAGGNLGAIIALWAFYEPDFGSDLLPFKACNVNGPKPHVYEERSRHLTPLYYWPEYGGMFHGPRRKRAAKALQSSDARLAVLRSVSELVSAGMLAIKSYSKYLVGS
eukprot:6470789-Amphidinium_carterae.1